MSTTLEVLLGCMVFGCVFGVVTHYCELLERWDRFTPRLQRRRVGPLVRPVQDLALDVRRIGARFHHPTPGTRFVKVEAIRQAYDDALTEACTCIDVVHLLRVLPAGPELDRERARVEQALRDAGLVLDPAGTSGR